MTSSAVWASAVAIGIGATIVTDLWALLRRRLFGTPLPNWGFVGRWIAYMPRGQFRHERIASTPAIVGERWVGWAAHYAIGATFAILFVALVGARWLQHPTPFPALAFGVATVAAPFLLMQPGMGLGIASAKAPRPAVARLHSIATHAVFGLGLYGCAFALAN